MENKKWSNRNSLVVRSADIYIGIKTEVLQFYIDNGEIECQDGRILKADCNKIKKQKEQFIGVKAFIMTHDKGH